MVTSVSGEVTSMANINLRHIYIIYITFTVQWMSIKQVSKCTIIAEFSSPLW